ncbi:helicase of the dead superfamily [Ceraceosorus bombacis]|uniref:Lipoamide acyltransferase component of branched-chain alpha-keto acid dehydrogenase complex, mitochondrial n=1 Tax=Ceraceosorus bombacis TaxID=401625 RepID=A0A0P1BT37_9BASI|nr:helicase of the dead superfamily [Ceraceosorus bombacis]
MIRRCTSSAIEHAGTASTSKSSVLLTPPAARMGSAVNHRRQSSYERASARLLAPDCLNLTLSPKWKRHGLQLSDRLDAGKRELHSTSTTRATRVVDYLLADVGEGITECEIIKWFVAPANDVAEFDALVEVQSDKA